MIANPLPIITFVVLTVALLIAAVNDIRFHKIPNWLTFTAIVAGIVYHTAMKGFSGFLFSVAGVGVGIAALIIPYIFKGTGAGDVKLMGAVGALLGPKDVFIAFLFTCIVGGIYAIILLFFHGYLKETAKRFGATLKTFIFTRKFIYNPCYDRGKGPKLCYGLAIALGTLFSVMFGNNIWQTVR